MAGEHGKIRAMRTSLLLVLSLLAAGHVQAADPVASVRVAFDRGGITETRVEGLADVATGRKVSAGDPVRLASIPKLVTTIGVIALGAAGTPALEPTLSR